MTQLFGINSEDEIDLSFSFKMASSFEEKSPDGWGYAFYHQGQWQSFKESLEMDKILRLDVKTMSPHVFQSNMFLSHVRYATLGKVTYENTHPFDRELFDSQWYFAHHGHLRLYRHIVDSMEYFKPMGDTDSETAFCIILENLREFGRIPNEKELAKSIQKTAKELAKQGGLNFLLTDGRLMHAFYSGYKTMYFTTLRPPFDEKIIAETDRIKMIIDTKDVSTPISLIASKPILDEADWIEFEIGTLYSFKNGQRIKYVYP